MREFRGFRLISGWEVFLWAALFLQIFGRVVRGYVETVHFYYYYYYYYYYYVHLFIYFLYIYIYIYTYIYIFFDKVFLAGGLGEVSVFCAG